jgi:hypothetical protein
MDLSIFNDTCLFTNFNRDDYDPNDINQLQEKPQQAMALWQDLLELSRKSWHSKSDFITCYVGSLMLTGSHIQCNYLNNYQYVHK